MADAAERLGEMMSVMVMLGDGRRVEASASERVPGAFEFVERDPQSGEVTARRLFRLLPQEGAWPRVVDVTDEVAKAPAAANKAGRRAAGERFRHLQSAAALEPLDYQERIEATGPVEVVVRRSVVPSDRGGIERVIVRKTVCTRRIVDARLWDAMTGNEQRAAGRIHIAFSIMARGLGAQVCALGRRYRAPQDEEQWLEAAAPRDPGKREEWEAELVSTYFSWGRECTKRRIDHSAIMDVLGYGFSCREADRRRRRGEKYTRRQLMAGLAVYCQLMGWQGRGGLVA